MIQPFLGHHHRLLLCRPTTTKRELSWVLMVGAHWFGKGKDYHLLVLLLLLPYLLCLGLGVCVHWFLEIEEQGKQSVREVGKGGVRESNVDVWDKVEKNAYISGRLFDQPYFSFPKNPNELYSRNLLINSSINIYWDIM